MVATITVGLGGCTDEAANSRSLKPPYSGANSDAQRGSYARADIGAFSQAHSCADEGTDDGTDSSADSSLM